MPTNKKKDKWETTIHWAFPNCLIWIAIDLIFIFTHESLLSLKANIG